LAGAVLSLVPHEEGVAQSDTGAAPLVPEPNLPAAEITASGAVQGLPALRAVTVASRRLLRGEIGVAEPVVVRLDARRVPPQGGDPPPTRQIGLSVVREWVVADVPEPNAFFVSIQLDPIDLNLPPQRSVSLSASREWVELAFPRQHRVNVSALHHWVEGRFPAQTSIGLTAFKSWRDLDLPEPTAGDIETRRHIPPTILVTEPLSVSAVIQRHYPKNLWSIPERNNVIRFNLTGRY
jgi:hypothetical protein